MCVCASVSFCLRDSVAQWLARRTRDSVGVDSIPITARCNCMGKQFTYVSSVYPSAKWVSAVRELKCIDDL